MANTERLPATVLRRKAVVYVRQSTPSQAQNNLESQRRQYDLVEEARRRGSMQVEVIDDALGRSASGMVARPGFDRFVAWLCDGEVGAALCFDASRLARNGPTGITCGSCAAWSRPVSSTGMAFTIRVVPTIGCC